MQGTYLSAEDEDWYRLEVTPSATDVLRIEVTAVAGVRPDLEVRALSDASLLATFHGADALLVRDLSLHLADSPDGGLPDGGAAGGGYYLVLKGHSRRGAPLAPYTILAAVEPGNHQGRRAG